jgi:D-sedoheptulose 7-phosphate isomerase
VLLFGNGGSAADADHIAGELAGRYRRDRPALPALALTGSSATLTAIANDYSYAEVFERPVRALANPGDVVIGLSTSGNSPNVLRGLQAARERGARTVGFTGASGGQMPAHADHLLQVPSNDTPLIQQAHLAAAHIICELVEQALFPK